MYLFRRSPVTGPRGFLPTGTDKSGSARRMPVVRLAPAGHGGDHRGTTARQEAPLCWRPESTRIRCQQRKQCRSGCRAPSRRRECPLCGPGAGRCGPVQAGAGELPIGVPGHWTMGVELVTWDIPGQRGQREAGRDRVHRVAGLQPRARSEGKPASLSPLLPAGAGARLASLPV